MLAPLRPVPPVGVLVWAGGVVVVDAVVDVVVVVGVVVAVVVVGVVVVVLVEVVEVGFVFVVVFVVVVFVVVLDVVVVVVDDVVLELVAGVLDVVVVLKIPRQFWSASTPIVWTPCWRLLTSVWLTAAIAAIERFRAATAVSTAPHWRWVTPAETCSSWLLRSLACCADRSPPLAPQPTSAETAKPRPPATIALFAKRIG